MQNLLEDSVLHNEIVSFTTKMYNSSISTVERMFFYGCAINMALSMSYCSMHLQQINAKYIKYY